jgi:hypothetical protein
MVILQQDRLMLPSEQFAVSACENPVSQPNQPAPHEDQLQSVAESIGQDWLIGVKAATNIPTRKI